MNYTQEVTKELFKYVFRFNVLVVFVNHHHTLHSALFCLKSLFSTKGNVVVKVVSI